MTKYNRLLDDTNIVFLDIDGVLNHSWCKHETDFTPESIEVLNQLYETHNIQIVLSTSWREAYIFTDLTAYLKEKGIKPPIIDKTPSYTGELTTEDVDTTCITEEEFMKKIDPMAGRNREILTYIRVHEVHSYVILDDLSFQHPELIPHLVQTSYWDKNGGLRKSHIPAIHKAFEIRNNP